MSDTNEGSSLSAPDLGGGWDDEPTPAAEPENEAVEPFEDDAEPEAKAEPKKAPEPKQPAPKKTPDIIEVDGRKLTIDEFKKELEKAKGADRKFREAAEKEKQVQEFMKRFEQDPLSILKDKRLPINQRELAEKMLLASLEEEMLSPVEREARELKSRLEDYESKEQAAKRDAEQRESDQRKEIKRQEISQMFAKAMESTPLSKDPETAAMAMRDMAMMLRAAKERGIEVSAEDLAQHAQNKYQKAMYSLANTLEGEDLIGFLGEDVIKKIRKADLARLKANDPHRQSHKDENWEVKANQPSKSKRMDAYAAREHARKMLFGK